MQYEGFFQTNVTDLPTAALIIDQTLQVDKILSCWSTLQMMFIVIFHCWKSVQTSSPHSKVFIFPIMFQLV